MQSLREQQSRILVSSAAPAVLDGQELDAALAGSGSVTLRIDELIEDAPTVTTGAAATQPSR